MQPQTRECPAGQGEPVDSIFWSRCAVLWSLLGELQDIASTADPGTARAGEGFGKRTWLEDFSWWGLSWQETSTASLLSFRCGRHLSFLRHAVEVLGS